MRTRTASMDPTKMTDLLRIDSLEVEFPTRRGTVTAVRDVALTVSPGEVVGLVGESGAGKSTIGNAVIDLLEAPGRVAAGSILFQGEELRTKDEDQMRRIRGDRIGMIFQDPQTSLNPLMTIGAQLEETIEKTAGLRGAKAEARAIELLESVGITEARNPASRPIPTSSPAGCASASSLRSRWPATRN